MKKIFTKGFIAVALVAVVGFVSSCKDYNDEIMAEYRGEDAKLEDLIDNLDELLDALTTKHNKEIQEAKDARDAMNTTLTNLINTTNQKQSDSIKWAVDSIGKLDARIEALENRVAAIDSVGGRLDVLENINAGQRLDDIEKALGALEEVVGDSVEIATWASDLKDLQSDMKTATTGYESLTKRLESMQNSIDGIKSCAVDCEALDSLVNKVMEPRLDSVVDAHNALSGDVTKLQKTVRNLNTLVITLNQNVNNLEEAVGLIEAEYQKADSVHSAKIDSLGLALTALEARVKANEEAIDSIFGEIELLKEDVADLKDGLKNRISSVLVQGAYSPVVGYFNMPFGIKSNILASYKGSVIDNMNFPFGFIEGVENSLIPLQASLGYDGETISELGNGAAGKLYLTINPAEVDLDSVDFALVNSQNELAPVELDSVVVSSDVLKFGYTRAGAPLYEAKATITDAAKASLDLNLGDYKDILSDLKNRNVNISDIAGTLYSSINEVAEANAVRASWTDSLGEHTVYSDFAVAAVAVKPLSFSFLSELNVQNIPGITRVHNFIDKAFDKVNKKLEDSIPSFDGLTFTAPEIKKIEIKSFDEFKDSIDLEIVITDTVKFDFELDTIIPIADKVVADKLVETGDFKTSVTVPAQKVPVTDANGLSTGDSITVPAQIVPVTVPGKNITVKGDTIVIEDFHLDITKHIEHPFTVKYSMEELIKSIYGEITTPIEGVNDMLGDLEDFMDDINDMLGELEKVQQIETSIKNAMDDVKGQLHSYLDKFNNKLCNVVNSLNDKLQPAMFVKTTGSFGVLSQSKNMPTVIENGAVLVPTTYTAELLAPAFKKYVAITAVDGSTANLAAANTGDLNKVLDGSVRAVEFNGESGKTYELTYAALDYDGNIATVKYYVTVK